jgi:hypothetical protein
MNHVPFLAVYAAVSLAGLGAVGAVFVWSANRRQERMREYRRVVRARLRVRHDRWLESMCEPDTGVRVRLTA